MTPLCASARILGLSYLGTYLHNISFGPILYNFPVIKEKSAAQITSSFFLYNVYSMGAMLVARNKIMLEKYRQLLLLPRVAH